MSLGQEGALCLKSSNQGIGLENNLRVPTLRSARIPLSTTCLSVDSLSTTVGSAQSKDGVFRSSWSGNQDATCRRATKPKHHSY